MSSIDLNTDIETIGNLRIFAKEMYLSDQALGALMMALQTSILNQTDIVPVLKGFKFKLSEQGLMVMNPPLVRMPESLEENTEE